MVVTTYLLHSPLLQHPLILFLGATALAAPLGAEEGACLLSLQNGQSLLDVFQTYGATPHALDIFRGDAGKVHRAGTHFALKKFPQAGEQFFIHCVIHHISDAFTAALGLFHVILCYSSISSGPVGSYGPSLTSIMTVPDSRARTVCHWPMGMFRATTGPPGESSMASVQRRSNSS